VIDGGTRAFEVGPMVRVHLAPWSRILAYVGTGATYVRWRQIYGTSEGQSRIDYHTLSIPLQAALGYFITRRIAVGVEFTYRWTWYGNVIARYQPGAGIEVYTQRGSSALTRFGELWMAGLVSRVRF
jgi:opacity protein-like surface antigen